MDCSRIQDRLVDYLTEETRITEQLCVEVHLATCYHCREAMEDVRTVLDEARLAIRYAGPERSFEAAINEFRTREALMSTGWNVTGQPANRWTWGVAASALPIVVACITPFIVAWPSRPAALLCDDTPERVTETVVEAHHLPRPRTNPLLRPMPTDFYNAIP